MLYSLYSFVVDFSSLFHCLDVLDDQRDIIKLQEQHLLSIDKENKENAAIMRQQRIQILKAEQERDRNATTTHTQLGKADAIQWKLDLNIKQYGDLKECYDSLEVKYTHLQHQYDTLQSDRNAVLQELTSILADREVVREKLRVKVL